NFTLTADILPITHAVQIIGQGFTIDADGRNGFYFGAPVDVSGLTITNFGSIAFEANLGDGQSLTFDDVSAEDGGHGLDLELENGATASITGGTFADLAGNGISIDDDYGNTFVSIAGTGFDTTFTTTATR